MKNLLIIVLCFFNCYFSNAQYNTITNDQFWYTKKNEPINSQGGGILKYYDSIKKQIIYYWYGAHYTEADSFRNNPTKIYTKTTFEAVTCYSSTDLVNWKFEGNTFTKQEGAKFGKFHWTGRLGVTYIKEIDSYVMLTQHDSGVLFAIAKKPTDEFKWHNKINMFKWIGTISTGDQTVFTDESNGKSYLIYCKPYGRNKIYVSEIGVKNGIVDLIDCTLVFEGQPREGNCMFAFNNKYYLCASNIYGWDGSYAYYLVADSIKGNYMPTNNMQVMRGCEADFSHISQTGFFVNVKGTNKETVIFCGDRWANYAGNGLGYNQWVPLSFENEKPIFNSVNKWQLNAQTGDWQVAAENNFVANSSFEADRRYVPTHIKPNQIYISGWETKVIKGNIISLDSTSSPVLNYFNSADDRKIVIGEKSLYINDNVNFNRKISQIIKSTANIKLKNGAYTLTAKVKNSIGFAQLEIYAKTKNKIKKYAITSKNDNWVTIVIKNIKVKKGKVEIGFNANGIANAFCMIDDVSFIKNL